MRREFTHVLTVLAIVIAICLYVLPVQAAKTMVPEITTQPKSLSLKVGETVKFTVEASGGSLSYLWYYSKDNGKTWTATTVAAGKTATYTITAKNYHDGYLYRCKVTNSKGYVTSNQVKLSVSSSTPKITTQPKAMTAAPGSKAVFKVTASGGALSYQWYYSKDGKTWNKSTIASGKTSEYTPTARTTYDGNQYRCRVTNLFGSIYSNAAKLNVMSKPVITQEPEDAEMLYGEKVSFEVAAQGDDLTYVWFYSKDDRATWTKTNEKWGGRSAVYTTESTATRNGYYYFCRISNAAGAVDSRAAKLHVIDTSVVITKEPVDAITGIGRKASFTVKADGEQLSYQWYYGTDGGKTWIASTLSAGKTDTYTVTVKDYHTNYIYRCVVSNKWNKAESAIVKITIPPAPEIIEQPETVIATGTTVKLTARVTGEAVDVTWYRKVGTGVWTAITATSGDPNSVTVQIGSSYDDSTLYRFKAVNPGGSVTSNTIRIINNPTVNVTSFDRGGLQAEEAMEVYSDYAARSPHYTFDYIKVTWKEDSGYTYQVFFFDKNYTICGHTEELTDSRTFNKDDYTGAEYFRIAIHREEAEALVGENPALPSGCSIKSSAGKLALTHDKPASQGVINFLKRVEQCINLRYTTQNVLPQQKGDITEGKDMYGMVYSSTRAEMLYVPNCVSFGTFMTAMKNPNSYVYSRVSALSNSRTYYGNVCSGMLSYAYDLGRVVESAEMRRLSCFTKRTNQDADHLKVGDLMVKSGHVICVYDILRDSTGKIVLVRFAQQTNVTAHVIGQTKAATNAWLSTIYTSYNYNDFDKVTYTESTWVSARGESTKSPTWNYYLSPRRGDKANWPVGETVEIDIMKKGNYTKAQLYKNGKLFKTTTLGTSMLLSYNDLEVGTYKVRLTDGTSYSKYCFFKVVSSKVTVEDVGNGKAKITFSCSDGTPAWYSWNTPITDIAPMHPRKTGVCSETMIKNGCVTSTYKAGSWLFNVYFTNDYGTYSSVPVWLSDLKYDERVKRIQLANRNVGDAMFIK